MKIETEDTPFFSVVIPCYNSEKYIKETIESVLKQTYKNWELIIVDDASTDASFDIISKIARTNEQIKLHRLKKNSGIALIPRTEGIHLSKGKYITYLDSDDTLENCYLEKLYNRIKDIDVDCILNISTSLINIDLNTCTSGKNCLKYTLNGWRINTGMTYTKKHYLECFAKISTDSYGAFSDEMLTRIIIMTADQVAFSNAIYNYRYNAASISRKVSIKQFNRLESSIRLKQLVYTNYETDSIERDLINKQLLFETINLSRYYIRHAKVLCKYKSQIHDKIMNAWHNIDFIDIKNGKLSKLCPILKHLNPFIIGYIVNFYASIKRR